MAVPGVRIVLSKEENKEKLSRNEYNLGGKQKGRGGLSAPPIFRRKSPGGALGYFLGGYVPPGTPNWHPVLKKISPKIDTPF